MKSLIAAFAVIVAIPSAYAGEGQGAAVLHDLQNPYGCFLSGGLVDPVPLWTSGIGPGQNIHAVGTPSGGVKLTCDFQIPEDYIPTKQVTVSGFLCGIYLPTGGAYTTNTSASATPGGQAHLQCTVTPNNN
jgi:hypothetical protein